MRSVPGMVLWRLELKELELVWVKVLKETVMTWDLMPVTGKGSAA
jgi:hypothetical protein